MCVRRTSSTPASTAPAADVRDAGGHAPARACRCPGRAHLMNVLAAIDGGRSSSACRVAAIERGGRRDSAGRAARRRDRSSPTARGSSTTRTTRARPPCSPRCRRSSARRRPAGASPCSARCCELGDASVTLHESLRPRGRRGRRRRARRRRRTRGRRAAPWRDADAGLPGASRLHRLRPASDAARCSGPRSSVPAISCSSKGRAARAPTSSPIGWREGALMLYLPPRSRFAIEVPASASSASSRSARRRRA